MSPICGHLLLYILLALHSSHFHFLVIPSGFASVLSIQSEAVSERHSNIDTAVIILLWHYLLTGLGWSEQGKQIFEFPIHRKHDLFFSDLRVVHIRPRPHCVIFFAQFQVLRLCAFYCSGDMTLLIPNDLLYDKKYPFINYVLTDVFFPWVQE